MDSFFENMQRRKVDMNSKPIITFKNVSKTYTLYKNDRARFKSLFIKPRNPVTHKALDNISFEIRRGEAVGIMGDNGGGKSTLLKHVTGVTFPDEGEIEVNGMVAALLELTAGFVLEMTGRENIRLKGYILGLNDDEIDEIEQNVVDFAELGVYIDQPVRTYSSGMKMRLGFAINVTSHPISSLSTRLSPSATRRSRLSVRRKSARLSRQASPCCTSATTRRPLRKSASARFSLKRAS